MTSDFRTDDRVLARWQGDRLWFPGIVHGVNGDTVAVQYDDGTSEIRPADEVKPLDWAVGTRIQAIWSGNGQWYDAAIMELDADGTGLTVRFDDGIREATVSGRCRSE